LGGLRKIDCITFRISDLEASARFYENVMGLKRGWTDPDRGMVGGATPTKTYLTPRTASLSTTWEFYNEYTERGYRVLDGPFDVRRGKYAVLEDLDGNRVDVIDLTGFGGKPRYDE